MARRILTWVEFSLAIASLGIALWPFSGFCSGRPFFHDCEGWAILSVNLFLPFGVIALACTVWGLRTPSRTPHLVIAATALILVGRIGVYALL